LCQRPDAPNSPWAVGPDDLGNEPHVAAVRIDEESCRLFRTVRYEDWLRYSLGYPAPSVNWFVQQHRELYKAIFAHLQAHPEETKFYLDIEKVCMSSLWLFGSNIANGDRPALASSPFIAFCALYRNSMSEKSECHSLRRSADGTMAQRVHRGTDSRSIQSPRSQPSTDVEEIVSSGSTI
jgi:hypothetical protein